MAYDQNNIFAKILRGEIPCKKVLETEHSLVFHDINPQAPVHVLAIPKGAYESVSDFAQQASAEESADLMKAIYDAAVALGIAEDGYRVLSNIGHNGHQEVPHLHFHIFGGRRFGRMIPAD
jgi:diadenosine tetraphosphate (Ap4A) HIT family hydrolase